MDRDSIDTFVQDDHVVFLIDTFNDERRAYQFRVNPLGVQADAINGAGGEDWSFDLIWASAGRITDEGYVVEVAIPFKQIRFPSGGRELTWSMELGRSWPRNARHRMADHPTDRDRGCGFCQFNKYVGFAGVEPGRNLELDPTVTGPAPTCARPSPTARFDSGDAEAEPGLTARWGITPNVSLGAAVNPDFSQVEADAAQLDVNERFALFFPEKRPFFLEGSEFFATPLQAVFTRTVADPRWGLKATGKSGQNGGGLFVTPDRVNNFLIPSNQGTDFGFAPGDVTAGVLRYRRDVLHAVDRRRALRRPRGGGRLPQPRRRHRRLLPDDRHRLAGRAVPALRHRVPAGGGAGVRPAAGRLRRRRLAGDLQPLQPQLGGQPLPAGPRRDLPRRQRLRRPRRRARRRTPC